MKLGEIGNSFRNIVRYATGSAFLLMLASCGGGGGSPGTVASGGGSGGNGVGSISLIFSSSELKSAGTVGGEVTVTALVKNANNAALPDIPVIFAANSGAVSVIDAKSDKNGQAKALLGTSGDRTNRKITVTVQAGGKTVSGSVDVVGTNVTATGPSAITMGGSGDFAITVKDSANVAVANVPVTFTSQKGNPITVKTSNGGSASAPLTNSQGQVVISMTAAQAGNDVISISSQGVTVTSAVGISASKVTVNVIDASGNPVTSANTNTSCQRVAARYEINGVPQSGTVNISTSRGNLYSDSACSIVAATSAVALVAGDSQPIYIKSGTAGGATITASIAGGPSVQTSIEFIAALTSTAIITLQAEPAVIGANSGLGQSERATLTAVVRDGTASNNFVKNAVVEFSVITDKSGGSLSNPSVVTTASNGSASATFIAGTADTPKDGVIIQARIQGTDKTATTSLTVSKRSLFISAGTGNKTATPTPATYQKEYTVFVTDSAGNPVPNVTVTASIIPTRYAKGGWAVNADKKWEQIVTDTCLNEDVNQSGVLDTGEDFNGSGKLEPGIPLSISSSGTTDASGTAMVSILYPRDRANWLEVRMTIRGSVSGTESTYQPPAFWLPIVAEDVQDENVSPPGHISPYGVNTCNLLN